MRRGTYFATSALVALNSEAEAGGVVIVTPPAEPEAASEAAVEIARIEGETAVALAEIHVAADLAHHELSVKQDEAFAETLAENINEGLEAEKDEWQRRAELAETELAALKAASSTPPASGSEPPPSPPHDAVEAALREAENQEPPAVEAPAEKPPEPAPEPRKRAKSHRWI